MAKEKKKQADDEKEIKNEATAKEDTAEVEAEKVPSPENDLKKELEAAKEQYLRLAAEYDNFRKRSQREKESLYAECKTSVIKEILPVIDNFERCVDFNENTSFEDYRKGVEMTYSQFGEAIKKLGIEAFGEEGEAFDPNLHNAVMHAEDENLPENSISKVLMKGYKVGDKIIRPAMVAVAN